ncbi:MAG: hypothetical protein ACKOCU_12505, partial [Betaproteobacteria bacterium]
MPNATPLTPRATAPFRFAWSTCGTAALALVALLAGGCAQRSPQASAAAAPETVQVRVIAFNDLHGNLENGNLSVQVADPTQPGNALRVAVGGADAMAGLVRSLRQSAP